MDEHTCILDRHLGFHVYECRCGERWAPFGGPKSDILFVSRELRERLSFYRSRIRSGHYSDLADGVRRVAERKRALAAEDALTAAGWIALQESKRRKHRAHLRAMVLGAGKPCAYCSDPDPQSVDHVIPLAQGGSWRIQNLAPACGRCNSAKGGRTPEQWKAARLARGLPWPPVWDERAA
jgi:HNH endonuclease